MEFDEKSLFSKIEEAERLHKASEHLVVVSYPFVKDSKLLLRALDSLFNSINLSIGAILSFESFYKRANEGNNFRENLSIFLNKCALRYGLSIEEQEMLKKIFILKQKHEESGFEFSRKGKIIMLDDSLGFSQLEPEVMKNFLKISKKVLTTSTLRFNDVFRKV